MTTKEYMSQAFYLDRKIKSKERQLEALKAHAIYVGPIYEERVSASPSNKSTMESAAVRIVELEKEIQVQIGELVSLKSEIERTIHSIGNDQYETLLEMRYLAFMSWKEISARLGYSGKYVYEVHGRALELVCFAD